MVLRQALLERSFNQFKDELKACLNLCFDDWILEQLLHFRPIEERESSHILGQAVEIGCELTPVTLCTRIASFSIQRGPESGTQLHNDRTYLSRIHRACAERAVEPTESAASAPR